MRIIPAIDIIDGKLVRLTKGDYTKKQIYSDSPLEVAKSFEDAGLKYLHLVDLDGAKLGKIVNLPILEEICSQTKLIVDFGGGVKTKDDVRRVINAGASQVTGGSIAVKDPEEFSSWISEFGAEKIILGCDVKDGFIAINGWESKSDLSIEKLLTLHSSAKYLVCTDISLDGTLQGIKKEFYENLQNSFPAKNWIASGGVSALDDLIKLKEINIFGAIIGKAIYENRISLKELGDFQGSNDAISTDSKNSSEAVL